MKAPKKRPTDPWQHTPYKPMKKVKSNHKPKKKKSFGFVKAAFDVVEDVFDDNPRLTHFYNVRAQIRWNPCAKSVLHDVI